ncbi:hypothetical protein [Streptomyces tsukubensis]
MAHRVGPFHLVRWRPVPPWRYALPVAVGTTSPVWLFVLMGQ